MRTFTATYPGRCTACPELIVEGEEITLGERGEPLHAECAGEPRVTAGAIVGVVCPKCWLVHRGECF